MDHHDLASHLAIGPLGLNHYLHIWLGTIQPLFGGKSTVVVGAPPVMGQDSLQMRIAKQWIKGRHTPCSSSRNHVSVKFQEFRASFHDKEN
jgi:hypothetical protein